MDRQISEACQRARDRELAEFGFVKREVFFTIDQRPGRIADGKLKIWRGVCDEDVFFSLDTFVERSDAYRRLSTIRPVPLRQFGAKTASHSRATWMIINRLLQTLCRRDVAAFLLKAFPLEYEGNVTDENGRLFERRQRALVRLYRERLGFVPVSDPSLAQKGWMLKLIKKGAAPDRD